MEKHKFQIVNHRTGKDRPVARTKVLSPQGEARMDGWYSLITGVGTAADKRMSNQVQWNQYDPEFFEQLYAGDEMASRIVDVVPEDALRKWIEFTNKEGKVEAELEKVCAALNAREIIEKTWKWGRAYGGALMYLVTDTNDPAAPFEDGEKVLSLRDLSRYDLRILTTDIETDFGSPNFGQPNIYYLNVQVGTNVKLYPIHHTRVVRFDGKLVPRRTYIRNNYWHDSVLQRLFNVIRNYQSSNDSAASILQDFNIGIYKMKGLNNFISAGKESKVRERLDLLNYSKSTIKAMLLDADMEEFSDLSRNVTGLPEMLQHQANRFVAATDIPHTKLLGESPDGSNATGNSTSQMWREYIESEQNNYLKPKLQELFRKIFGKDVTFKFKELEKLSALEEADLRSKQADTDCKYIEKGVLDPEEVARSRFGGLEYSTETNVDWEARESGEIVPGSDEPDGDEGDENAKDNGEAPNDFAKTPEANNKEPKKDSEPDQSGYDLPGSGKYKLNNQGGPGEEKVEPFISQTESLPFRSNRNTDPMPKPPGRPNKPRSIDWNGKFSAALKMDSMPHGAASVVVRNKEGAILMGKRKDTGKWALPGGKLNKNELATTGAARELYEETALKGKLLPLSSHQQATGIVHTFMMEHKGNGKADHTNDPDQEFDSLHWVDCKDGLPSHVVQNLHHQPNLALMDAGLIPAMKQDAGESAFMPRQLDDVKGKKTKKE